MEDVVAEELETLLPEYPEVCQCKRCQTDIMVMALNRLPPKYASTNKGNVYVMISATEPQNEADVTLEVTKAIERVSKNPRH